MIDFPLPLAEPNHGQGKVQRAWQFRDAHPTEPGGHVPMPHAYRYTRFGGPEVATLAEVPALTPGPGQLLVAVRAAGVNPVDWKRRSGRHPPDAPPLPLPAVLGSEVAGVVQRLGDGVTGFAVGDPVLGGALTGGYAQYALLCAELAVRKPPGLSFADAAALPVASATALNGVRGLRLPVGATVLVNGVSGGVGVAAAQIAAHDGLRVVGTASAGKREFVESLGVRHVASGPGVAERVRAAAPGGVDGILDLVGGGSLAELAGLLTDRSTLVSAVGRDAVVGLGGAPVARAHTSRALAEVVRLASDGALHPLVTRVFPFAEALAALALVEAGHARGKIVIEV
jgi:NADPH:quinone reductase-like Zn-dependent oxidoreductase